eukprot:s849_g21.t1
MCVLPWTETKKFISKIKDDPMMPIGTKWQKIKAKLQVHGLFYQQTLKPTQLLVHPLNRGDAMLSHHDCHDKGAKISAIGPELEKIQASVATEISNQMEAKSRWLPWDIMVSQVEEDFPDLPQPVQAALNSSHGIAQQQTEMEIMASMASHYAHTKDLKKAMQLAESTKPRNLVPEATWAVAERHFGIFASKSMAKGKLKIYPMGQVAPVKEGKANMVLIHGPHDSKFQIIPPKVDLEKKTGVLVPFFHLVKSAGGNIEVAMTRTENGFQVPFLKNNTKVVLAQGSKIAIMASICTMLVISWNGKQVAIPDEVVVQHEDVKFLKLVPSNNRILQLLVPGNPKKNSTLTKCTLLQELKAKRDHALSQILQSEAAGEDNPMGMEGTKKQKLPKQSIDLAVAIDVEGTTVNCLATKNKKNTELLIEMDQNQIAAIFNYILPDAKEISQTPKKTKRKRGDPKAAEGPDGEKSDS